MWITFIKIIVQIFAQAKKDCIFDISINRRKA